MSQGFIFSSMSYKLSHKTLPITIVIDVNFKQTDLKINIVKTYQLEDDGIERLAPLPASDQSLYIDYFQNVAYAVYSNLIEKQKTELVKQTIKPEKQNMFKNGWFHQTIRFYLKIDLGQDSLIFRNIYVPGQAW